MVEPLSMATTVISKITTYSYATVVILSFHLFICLQVWMGWSYIL